MDIVDSQIHLFLTMDAAAALAVMDSLGIQAALIDEFWGYEGDQPMPGYQTEDGVFRPRAPGATMASLRHPDRFSWLLRIHMFDKDFEALMAEVKASPHGRAVRLEARSEREVRTLAEGGCMAYFRAAEQAGLPLFFIGPGHASLLRPYAQACPDLPIVIDHCGLPPQVRDYDAVLAMAKYSNVFLKWCHAPRLFGAPDYPFAELAPILARTLDAFGPERIMWASDFTHIRNGRTWAETLFYMREHPGLSAGDKEWIMGRTARTVLDWPTPATLAQPPQHQARN